MNYRERFAELFEAYAEGLFRAAVRWLGSVPDAEDVVQEVFVSVARSIAENQQIDHPKAYLFTALRRKVRLRWRDKQKRGSLYESTDDAVLQVVGDSQRTAEQVLQDRETAANLLARLSLEQREVVVLKLDGGLTFAEIAAACEISPHTAASRYRYALKHMTRVADEMEASPQMETTHDNPAK